jgi:hypothetical protein
VDEHEAPRTGPRGTDLVSALVRWQQSGGTWRVVGRRPDRVTVALLRCDGGEEVDRLDSSDPLWLEHLRGREGSED